MGGGGNAAPPPGPVFALMRITGHRFLAPASTMRSDLSGCQLHLSPHPTSPPPPHPAPHLSSYTPRPWLKELQEVVSALRKGTTQEFKGRTVPTFPEMSADTRLPGVRRPHQPPPPQSPCLPGLQPAACSLLSGCRCLGSAQRQGRVDCGSSAADVVQPPACCRSLSPPPISGNPQACELILPFAPTCSHPHRPCLLRTSVPPRCTS
jgi:hypothetical protein